MRATKFRTSLHIRTVSSEPMLFTHVSDRPTENFSQTTRRVALLRGRALRKIDSSIFLVTRLNDARPTDDQEVVGSIPPGPATFFCEN